MIEKDLILDSSHMPTYEEILYYMNKSGQNLWQEINSFIQQTFKVSPNITYSKCSGKPGWNIKYQKAGKSICTLYPEKDGFVALVVVTLNTIPVIEAMAEDFEPEILERIKSAKPFNGTLWLMVQGKKGSIVNSIKRLLILKHEAKHMALG